MFKLLKKHLSLQNLLILTACALLLVFIGIPDRKKKQEALVNNPYSASDSITENPESKNIQNKPLDTKIGDASSNVSQTTNSASCFITYKLLGKTALNMNHLPPIYPKKLIDLNGKRVSIIGFMAPVDEVDNAKHFFLVSSVAGCYFCCNPPTLLNLVYIKLKEKKKTKIYEEAVKVTGIFHLLEGSTPLKDRKSGYENQLLYSFLDASVIKATPADISNSAREETSKQK